MLELFSFGLLGLVIVVALIPLLRQQWIERAFGRRRHQFHQTHNHSISRLGGLALAIAFLILAVATYWFAGEDNERSYLRLVMMGGALAMFAVGFWDDLQPLGAKKKLLAQVIIAAAVHFLGLHIEGVSLPFSDVPLQLGSFSVLATVVWLVSLTNLINLIDGMDGLATGISLMLMGLMVYVGYTANSFPLLIGGVAGSLVGFLIFNFPPAKIHLGDGGAYFLGFLIGELTIASSNKGTVVTAMIAPLFVLALPILDVSLTILRRGLRGLPVFRADLGHIHHRLLQMGLSRQRAVMGMYGFTMVFLLLGLAAFRSKVQLLPIFTGVGMLIVVVVMSWMNFSRRWFNLGDALGHSLRMREDIAYALALARWLALESRRGDSTEEFWKGLQFATERLGFCHLRLQLEGGERTWETPDAQVADCHFVRFDFREAGAGVIELQARKPAGVDRPPPPAAGTGNRQPGAGLEDERTFRVISELLAESWHKASLQKCERTGEALRFASSPPPPPSAPLTVRPAEPLAEQSFRVGLPVHGATASDRPASNPKGAGPVEENPANRGTPAIRLDPENQTP